MKHFELWDKETINLMGYYHTEEAANNFAADVYRANPQMKPGEIIVISNDEECEPDCRARPALPLSSSAQDVSS